MAVVTRPLKIPARLAEVADRAVIGLFQRIIDRVEKPRIAAVADLDQTISNPPTQAEVQALSNKVDELLAAMRTATVLEE